MAIAFKLILKIAIFVYCFNKFDIKHIVTIIKYKYISIY